METNKNRKNINKVTYLQHIYNGCNHRNQAN